MKTLTQYKLIIFVALFFVLVDNISFFSNVLVVYPLSFETVWYHFSIVLVLFLLIVFLFSLFASKYTTKPLLIVALIVSASTNYFMQTYNIVIDTNMIRNTLQTDIHESLDLLSWQLVVYVVFLGIVPSYIVYKVPVSYRTFKKELWSKVKTVTLALLIIVLLLVASGKFFTSFFREHKSLRYYTNPTYWIYNIGSYIGLTLDAGPTVLKSLGMDATITADGNKPRLVVMVVGEAARADRFSLNGYARKTNPMLEKENIINFPNTYSCGTSTAVSVPCMFCVYGKDDYSYKKGISTQNVLDVLDHTKKVNILWRDNNSDSKGVALRVAYENYKTAAKNTICIDNECRDEGMLVGLDAYVEKYANQNILIILHQMGNHGPAYYKRYPKAFEMFTPVCKTNQLEECTQEEVSNAYDNAILYTDYFLKRVIDFLKPYSKSYDTAMLYMSDHGESLGEHGLYLHGMPYFIAPDAQTHIGAIMWFGGDRFDMKKLKAISQEHFSQDNLFHTLLGLFDVNTTVYIPKMDTLNKLKNE